MPVLPQGVTRLLVKAPADLPPPSLLSHLIPTAIMQKLGPVVGDHEWHMLAMPPGVAAHPWDMAHALVKTAVAAGQTTTFAEPDFQQMSPSAVAMTMAINAMAMGAAGDLDSHWPPAGAVNAPFDWHLDAQFSGLRDARKTVGDNPSPRRVRIGHLDTGYSEVHETCPLHLRRDAAWNFVENSASAVDPASYHGVLQNPGHGPATIALLAGNVCSRTGDFLGGAPYADVIPVRVANSVVHFGTSAIAMGIHHALGWGCDIISLSMGGVPSQSWADMVNAAYDAGCIIFAASGDSIGGLPTHFTVYPARFRRVVSVCGVTFNGLPYFDHKYDFHQVLEGNFGPDAAMETAISCYTPNVPWAKANTPKDYSSSGGGTSASTPQVAAAAALYIQQNLRDLLQLQGGQRVEAVRSGLFTKAKQADKKFFGQGILQAAEALNVPVNNAAPLQPKDTIDFALFKELFGFDLFSQGQQNMLMLEAVQLAAESNEVQRMTGGADIDPSQLSADDRKAAVNALLASSATSQTLKEFLATARAAM